MIGLGLAGAAEGNPLQVVTVPDPDPDPGNGPFAPRTDLPMMRLVFDENFNTAVPEGQFMQVYGNRFGNYSDGTPDTAGGQGANSIYHANTLSVGQSLDPSMGLVLKIRQRIGTGASNPAHNNRPWGAALRPRWHNLDWTFNSMLYGRMQVGVRCWRAIPGFKTAWLNWPTVEPWPKGGELDYPEGNLTSAFRAFFHNDEGTSFGDQQIFPPQSQPAIPWIGGWYEVATHWAPNFAQPIHNGRALGTMTNRVPNSRMHWILQCERAIETAPTNTTGDCLLEIAYVSLWTYTG